ncbi:hypothetical protein ACFFSW_07155 [Saccharothrix longispora]|uniref:Uncharacterized protein n=1 Tax=Saccharothrix longispora TaxID=33920 RepID=A0ABU1PTE4_9PSEU|nr:hypothetical protein [Saccharothrix longispora]MDR6593721.1 hypothetical protein [Saccharothrix longispora]
MTRSDEELAVGLLAATPTHEDRAPELLLRWARVALAYGDELVPLVPITSVLTKDARGGVTDRQVTLAEYNRRTDVVTVYRDSVELLASLSGEDPAALRTAAVAHEVVHRHLHGPPARELRRRLDHCALRVGRLRVRGHVAGADEVVAHRFAHRVGGLRRSPLSLTALLADSLVVQGG